MTPSPVSSSHSRQFNLSKLEPPTFNAEYMQWTSYWDLFDASVHKNTSVTNAQKLQYLRRSLKVESVSKLISHLSVTDANYDTARKIMQTRYSNKRLIVRSHIQAMMSFPPLTQESVEGIRQLLECFQENTRSSIAQQQSGCAPQSNNRYNKPADEINSQPQSGLWKDSASGSTKYGKCQQQKLITAPAEIVTAVAKSISPATVPATARWIMTTGLQLSRRRNSASTVFARITRQRIVRANLLVESAMVSITQLFTENKNRRSP